ncbi:ATP-binding cassette sub-family G member 4-like [Aphidius gifuensis]|uniref:ATP-binding cassette sub-family G member 4-like n=1 Tax=Aphidius gifuensis TaxID=684658 RepID=UPI001CDB499F|nr:ATP-binding cassette sub-family G member 4-like [Aphidius gifuensis]
MILKGISGQFKCNELTAILGPSGSGKSTLLNILTGYTSHGIGGTIKVNGKVTNMQYFKKMTCYIMQDDLLQPKLTVIEAMNFSADLKLGNSVSYEQKKIIITKILETLRLTNAENTIMERLSGGERKRLAIALELVNNPPVIFLDEPTTGLDELSSVQCINLLRQVAEGGRTVICSIHTPSANIFSKFHHVYVVANGQCAYRGPVNNLVPFLNDVGIECPKHYNPADFVVDIASGEYGTKFIDSMISEVNTKYPITPIQQSLTTIDIETIYKNTIKISWQTQFCTLLKRMMIQLLREKDYLGLKLFLYIFLGFIIGGIYFEIALDGSKTIENLFFCHTTLFYFLTVPMLPIPLRFPIELRIVEREHFNRWYRITPYFLASTVSCVPIYFFLCTIHLSITYIMSSQTLELSRFAMFFTISFVFGLVSETIGYIIGSVFNVATGVFAGAVVISASHVSTIQGLGSTEKLPWYRLLMMYSSPFRWSIEGLISSVYGFEKEDLECPDHIDYCPYRKVVDTMSVGRFEDANYGLDFSVVIVYYIILRALLYYIVRQIFQPNALFRALGARIPRSMRLK